MRSKSRASDKYAGQLVAVNGVSFGAMPRGYWEGELYRPVVGLVERVIRWKEAATKEGMPEYLQFLELSKKGLLGLIDRWSWRNIIVDVGCDQVLDVYFGAEAKPSQFVGLKDTGTPVVGDTMGSHGSWATIAPYSNGTDPAYVPGTATSKSIDNSASKAAFNIDGTDTVYGAFLKDDDTKSGSAGVLYASGDFSVSRAVGSGDTLNVTATFTQADDGV
jgi:hypothetical protein